ncbi:MAG: deoxyribonuclease IV [Simkaniaceae bacterium]|nr:deoxyribonuclease IV [Simkaniaceae bacterium]
MAHHLPLLIGAHTSAAGGAHKALLHGERIGATTIQLFTANQKQWKGKPISDEEMGLWFEALEKTGIQKVMSHDSYLINLGSPDDEVLGKSHTAFEEEIKRCHQLKLSFLNFHPGAYTKGSPEACLDQIVNSLLKMEKLAAQGPTRLLLESTAGQGTALGYDFAHLGYIIDRVKDRIPIGVCIDTCHSFAAGYDIRSKEGWDRTLDQFEKEVGLEHLYAMHTNDSLKPLGSRRDRHASLGKGEIGMECFKVMMTHPKLKNIPKYLETPNPDIWKDEIALLRGFGK